jgi:hypothetical protein
LIPSEESVFGDFFDLGFFDGGEINAASVSRFLLVLWACWLTCL